MTAPNLKSFTASTARPLPVIVLADTSGSMSSDGKIGALNTALADMARAFAEAEGPRAEIHVAVITFGGAAQVHQPLKPAGQITLAPLGANGNTPLGGALDLARALLEDREQVPGRAYTPALVLVSDGQPNDAWEPALERLFTSERAKKAQRFALGIGPDADGAMLARFLANPEAKVLGAADARQIQNFFRWVTMSVTRRSKSTTPNEPLPPEPPPADLDALL
jgi:uncharacterized protein YegL